MKGVSLEEEDGHMSQELFEKDVHQEARQFARNRRMALMASIIGSTIEWYDFLVSE